TVCVVGKMRDLILQLSKSSIYSTKPVSTSDGFNYHAGELAAPFISSLTTEYSCRLKVCAEWVIGEFKDLPTQEIRNITHRLFQQWSSQFQSIQSSGG
ncbi:ABC-three component system middle component 2, partial [Raoultella planticola]|nr:ABC-three component system middle component 2 [Raoultella planticola]